MKDAPAPPSPPRNLPSFHQLTPAERAWKYAITIEWIEASGDNLVLAMRCWKTSKGQQKHWESVPQAREKTRFVLVKHGLDEPEGAKPIAPAIVEKLTRKKIDQLLDSAPRNMRVVGGQLTPSRKKRS